jgi:tetratricopeptide (TPR) repeat protein
MVSPPPGSELGTRGVERELAKLFGESLFGPWPELGQLPVRAPPPRRGRRRTWLVIALVAALATVFGINAVIRPGLARRSLDERAHFAQDLRRFLKDGDLERVSRYIPLVRGGQEARPAAAHLDLVVRAEAAAYRYRDADPERLRRIEPELATAFDPNASPDRLIAFLTVLSREERAARLPELERLRDKINDKMDRDSEPFYLLATALEQRGDVSAARRAWEASARLGPAWLVHRFEQADFERQQGDAATAANIARRMLEVDPQSAWSRLAIDAFGGKPDALASAHEAGRGAQTPAPVEVFYERLLEGVDAAQKGDLRQAQRSLQEAVDAVHGQAPFVLDAFDWLVAEHSQVLARELTASPAWPLDSPVARAKAKRLADAPFAEKAKRRP